MSRHALAAKAPPSISGSQRSPFTIDVMLGLVTMAGPLYIDIMPAFIAALRTEYGLRPEQAGFVAASNGYGATVGALLALFCVMRMPWRASLVGLLLVLIAADLVTMAISDFEMLLGVRFIHGIAGGLLVGFTYALMSQTLDPRRSFGVLFTFHFGFGGVGIALSSLLADMLHRGIVFGVLAGFSLAALILVPMLPPFRQPGATGAAEADEKQWLTPPLLLRIGGIFLFQAANLGLGAFLIGIGIDQGQTRLFAGSVVGIGLAAGVPGAIAMMMLSRTLGWRPIVPALVIAGLAKLLVIFGTTPAGFALAVAAVYLTMAVALPYVLASCAKDDAAGRATVLGGFASKLGLACGPAVAGILYTMGSTVLVSASVATVMLAAACFALSFRIDPKR